MIEITHDVFDIAWRVKEIDSEYRLYYNRRQARYEVHRRGVLEAVIPYDTLDARTLTYLRQTRRENMDALIAYIDSENERLERERAYEMKSRALSRIEEVLR